MSRASPKARVVAPSLIKTTTALGVPLRSLDGLPRDIASVLSGLPEESDTFSAVIEALQPGGGYPKMIGDILQPLAGLLQLGPDEHDPFRPGVRRDIGQLATVGDALCCGAL